MNAAPFSRPRHSTVSSHNLSSLLPETLSRWGSPHPAPKATAQDQHWPWSSASSRELLSDGHPPLQVRREAGESQWEQSHRAAGAILIPGHDQEPASCGRFNKGARPALPQHPCPSACASSSRLAPRLCLPGHCPCLLSPQCHLDHPAFPIQGLQPCRSLHVSGSQFSSHPP